MLYIVLGYCTWSLNNINYYLSLKVNNVTPSNCYLLKGNCVLTSNNTGLFCQLRYYINRHICMYFGSMLCLLDSSTLLCVIIDSFSLLNSIPLYHDITLYLSIPLACIPLLSICTVSNLELLRIVLL